MRKPFRKNTAAEEAAIQSGIEADPDTTELGDDFFARARPTGEMLPQLVRRRGPQKSPTKLLVSLRLDRDVVERLKESGPGWQSRVNEMLRRSL